MCPSLVGVPGRGEVERNRHDSGGHGEKGGSNPEQGGGFSSVLSVGKGLWGGTGGTLVTSETRGRVGKKWAGGLIVRGRRGAEGKVRSRRRTA